MLSPIKLKNPDRMSISYSDINYRVKDKEILHNVSGRIQPGEFVAIMGPSGSGKTSLLNILSGRVKEGVSGTIKINGKRPRKKEIGFVEQQDVLFPNLTVRQTLDFTVAIRHPNMPKEEQEDHVRDLTSILGLEGVLDTKVGDSESRGISGGEKKRVNICNQLLSFPSVLFLDEPTSGLDTATAIHLLKMLKKLSETGVTVLFSIHQPPSQTYKLFDKLFFLLDGNIVFSGPPRNLSKHLRRLGVKKDKDLNAADHVMMQVWEDPSTKKKYIGQWDTKDLEEASNEDLSSKTTINPKKINPEKNAMNEIYLLTKRSFFQNLWVFLDPAENVAMLIRTFFMSSIWFGALMTFSRIEEAAAIVYMSLIVATLFMPAYSGLSTYTGEYPIIKREMYTGTYSLFSYYIAKTLSEIPCLILRPTIFIVPFYLMVGLNRSAEGFFFCYLILLLNTFVFNAVGLIVSVVCKSTNQAGHVLEGVLMIMSFVAGFWARYIPVWISWIQYISPMAYSYQSLLLNEFEHKYYTNSTVFYSESNYTATTVYNGDEFLTNFPLFLNSKFLYIPILILYIIAFRLITYMCLKIHFMNTKVMKKCC